MRRLEERHYGTARLKPRESSGDEIGDDHIVKTRAETQHEDDGFSRTSLTQLARHTAHYLLSDIDSGGTAPHEAHYMIANDTNRQLS